MKFNSLRASLLALLTFSLTQVTLADQIDKEAGEVVSTAPQAVLVKVNPETKMVEVFRANSVDSKILNKTANANETVNAVRAIENSANKVAEFALTTGELDKDSSTEAWNYRWRSNYWSWNSWGGYSPYYYNWNSPYTQPGYFNYGYSYQYNYSWYYNYNNCNYSWYY